MLHTVAETQKTSLSRKLQRPRLMMFGIKSTKHKEGTIQKIRRAFC